MKTILPTIGLFGTCGNSTWRKPFMDYYDKESIAYFNPQVPDWNPAFAKEEAKHLAHDGIILFPVLAETYGCGSLAETGFSIAQAMRYDDRRDFVILIDPTPDPSLDIDNPDKRLSRVAYKESCRARALALEHLKGFGLRNAFFVDTIDQMFNVSLTLWSSMMVRLEITDQFSLAALQRRSLLEG